MPGNMTPEEYEEWLLSQEGGAAATQAPEGSIVSAEEQQTAGLAPPVDDSITRPNTNTERMDRLPQPPPPPPPNGGRAPWIPSVDEETVRRLKLQGGADPEEGVGPEFGDPSEDPLPDIGPRPSIPGGPGGPFEFDERFDDWLAEYQDWVREQMETGSRYDADLVRQGQQVIEDTMNRRRDEVVQKLGEHFAARGLTASSLEADQTREILVQMSEEERRQLFELGREQANVWAQDMAMLGQLGRGVGEMMLQQRALDLHREGMERDDAFRWAQLEAQVELEHRSQQLQKLGLDRQQARWQAEFERDAGWREEDRERADRELIISISLEYGIPIDDLVDENGNIDWGAVGQATGNQGTGGGGGLEGDAWMGQHGDTVMQGWRDQGMVGDIPESVLFGNGWRPEGWGGWSVAERSAWLQDNFGWPQDLAYRNAQSDGHAPPG